MIKVVTLLSTTVLFALKMFAYYVPNRLGAVANVGAASKYYQETGVGIQFRNIG
jgi:hypothetical protein